MKIAILSRGRRLYSTRSLREASRVRARRTAISAPLRCYLRSVFLCILLAAAPAGAEVVLEGLDGAQSANVLAHLSLDEDGCDVPRWRVEQQYQAAPARIREALEALGHYGPTVTPRLEFDDECWHATFTIAPGEPVLIRSVDVALDGEAVRDTAFIAARDETPMKAGDVLDHGTYERLKRRWSDLAQERGYMDARFTANRIDVYPPEHVADIVLRFDSGPRYAFGDVQLEQDVLSDQLVRSYLPFHPGDLYDARELTEMYAELADSGYFRTIDVRPLEPDREHREIPIAITLVGSARRQISYGIGFSTDTGPRFRFGRNNRRFNDRGHLFGVNGQLSPVVSEVTAGYRLPYGDPRSEWISFDAGVKREDTETSESESLQLGARRVLERPGDWTRTQMVNLLVEDFEVADQVGRSRLLMPGIVWTKIRADNSIRPQRGYKVELEVRAAADALGSDTTFAQTIARAKWIWSLPSSARILVRADAGATAEQSFDELPPSVRFFAGGDNSVRGYDFEALGPVDEQGEVIGGSSLATASIEYEHPVRARWSVAVFVDAGNAFERSAMDAKVGAGFGTRWQSPLGPIRLDLAHPFDDPTTDWRVHVTLGPDL
jgi:translocation and assembly module TamA